jgi:hypothetical protein
MADNSAVLSASLLYWGAFSFALFIAVFTNLEIAIRTTVFRNIAIPKIKIT